MATAPLKKRREQMILRATPLLQAGWRFSVD